MSYQLFSVNTLLAQAKVSEKPAPTTQATNACGGEMPIVGGLGFLTFVLAAALIWRQMTAVKAQKAVKFEKFKNDDLSKKLKLALETIKKLETNPDLNYAREFNLDYLRLRMDEEVFHYVIVNQIKMKIRQLITEVLRPDNTVGISNSARKIDKIFDVNYETESQGKLRKSVLFRLQIKLTKLPIRPSSTIVDEIIECIERYLCPSDEENWHPTIEGRVVTIRWEQKAKPTPLLVLEQSEEGASVTFKKDNWRAPSKKEGKAQMS